MKIPKKYDDLIYAGYEDLLNQGIPISKIADLLNQEWATSFSESSMRGRYQQEKLAGAKSIDEYEYQNQLFQLAKSKLAVTESRKIINRERSMVDSRVREYSEKMLISDIIREAYNATAVHNEIMSIKLPVGYDEKRHIYALSDIHWGYEIDLQGVTYNTTVAEQRMTEFFEWVVQDTKRKGYKEILIVDAGDQIEGASLRISQLTRIAEMMTVQAKNYANVFTKLLKYISKELKDVKITVAQVSEDNHAQIRLYSTKRDEMGENLALLITNTVDNTITTAHEFGGMQNVTYLHGDEILISLDGFNIVIAHGHQYGRNEDILQDVEFRHKCVVHLFIAGHWHQFSIKYKNVKDGGQQCLIFLPSGVGDTDFSESLFLSCYPGFAKISVNLTYRTTNAKFVRFN